MYSYSWRPTVKENWQEASQGVECLNWSAVIALPTEAASFPGPRPAFRRLHYPLYVPQATGGLKGEGSVLQRSKIMRQLRVNDLLIGLNRGCALRSAVCTCAVTVTSQDQWWSLVDPPSPCLWSGTEHNWTQRSLKPRRFAYFRNDCTIGDFPLVFLT